MKRYHGSSWLHRLLDGRRARRERSNLEAARSAGLPVPRVLDLRREGGSWELCTEHLPGARSLRSLLDGRDEWPVPRTQLLQALARLHARALGLGLVHADLHAGNVLVDGSGQPWLIDLAHARLGTAPQASLVEEQLVAIGADVREKLPARLRARYALALRRQLEPELRAQLLAPWDEWLQRLDTSTRARRLADVERGAERWLRTSSAARDWREGSAGSERRGVLRADVPPETGRSWAEAARSMDPRQELLELEGSTLLVVRARSREELRATWRSGARLAEHGVPAAMPAVLALRPEPMAIFEQPAGARPLALQAGDGRALPWRRRAARSAGELLGTLMERGLSLRDPRPDDLWLGADGEQAALDPRVHLVAGAKAGRQELLETFTGWLEGPMEAELFRMAVERGEAGA